MLFGMFFGAGNLIFPAYLGRQAGSAVWPAIAGPAGYGRRASAAGSCRHRHHPQRRPACPEPKGEPPLRPVLYLRAVSDHRPVFRDSALRHRAPSPWAWSRWWGAEHSGLALALFSLVFFTIVAAFSLRPASILTSIGRTLTPAVPAVFRRACGNGAGAPRRLPPTRAPGELPLRPLLRRLPGRV